jgi:hypothetical protein
MAAMPRQPASVPGELPYLDNLSGCNELTHPTSLGCSRRTLRTPSPLRAGEPRWRLAGLGRCAAAVPLGGGGEAPAGDPLRRAAARRRAHVRPGRRVAAADAAAGAAARDPVHRLRAAQPALPRGRRPGVDHGPARACTAEASVSRRIRRYDVGRVCHRCRGPLREYAGGEYVQCQRCGKAEWRPRLPPKASSADVSTPDRRRAS